MNVPGEKEYSARAWPTARTATVRCSRASASPVIGGGNSGVEAAIDLAGIVAHVTLIEFDGKLRADEVLQRKLRSLRTYGDRLRADNQVHGADGKVNALSYKDRSSGEVHRVELEGVFVQIGLLPNTDWLKGTVALVAARRDRSRRPRARRRCRACLAAGDVTTVPYKQIIIAMGEGSKAALSAFDHLIRVPVTARRSRSRLRFSTARFDVARQTAAQRRCVALKVGG
jgi:alkyl hydroperoxide reductase subunit F